MKKIFAGLLFLVLTSLAFVGCQPYLKKDGFKYIADTEATLVEYNGKSLEIVIPDEVDGIPVVKVGRSLRPEKNRTKGVFEGRDITSVEIGNNVDIIWDRTFAECTSLERVIMSAKIRGIMGEAFLNCQNLEEIAISSSSEEGTVISESAFAGCTSLERVTLENIRTIWPNAFKDCTSLTKIYLGKEIRTVFADAFSGCTSLEIYCEGSEADCAEWGENWNSGRPVHYGSTRADATDA